MSISGSLQQAARALGRAWRKERRSPFEVWLGERVEAGFRYRTSFAALYDDYRSWLAAEDAEVPPTSPRVFGQALGDRGLHLGGHDGLGRRFYRCRLLPITGERRPLVDTNPPRSSGRRKVGHASFLDTWKGGAA